MSRSAALSLLALGLCLVACGGKSLNAGDPGDGEAGSNNAGGSGSGGSGAHAGKASGGSSSSGTGSGGGSVAGAPSKCDYFNDDEGWTVAVRLSNQTQRTLNLGSTMVSCGVEPLFQVADAQGAPLASLGSCRNACEAFIEQGVGGCPAICLFPSAITIQPGESSVVLWNGLYSVTSQAPAGCLPPERRNDVAQCDVAKQIAPGTFTFTAIAATELDCSQTTGGPCGACMNNSGGGCITQGALIGGDLVKALTTVELGPAQGVGLGGGETLSVDLTFEE